MNPEDRRNAANRPLRIPNPVQNVVRPPVLPTPETGRGSNADRWVQDRYDQFVAWAADHLVAPDDDANEDEFFRLAYEQPARAILFAGGDVNDVLAWEDVYTARLRAYGVS